MRCSLVGGVVVDAFRGGGVVDAALEARFELVFERGFHAGHVTARGAVTLVIRIIIPIMDHLTEGFVVVQDRVVAAPRIVAQSCAGGASALGVEVVLAVAVAASIRILGELAARAKAGLSGRGGGGKENDGSSNDLHVGGRKFLRLLMMIIWGHLSGNIDQSQRIEQAVSKVYIRNNSNGMSQELQLNRGGVVADNRMSEG